MEGSPSAKLKSEVWWLLTDVLLLGKTIPCACITQCQNTVIHVVFDPEEWWWTDPPMHRRSVPFQRSTTSEHPTRNVQSATWSTATCEAVLPQPSSVTSFVSLHTTTSWRSFPTCQQTWTFVRILHGMLHGELYIFTEHCTINAVMFSCCLNLHWTAQPSPDMLPKFLYVLYERHEHYFSRKR
jgi:hypothetical protein